MTAAPQPRILRPALRYFGGKWRLAPWIISHFPPHVCYVEPFGGAASVLLQKPRSSAEVYNDLNSRVVNFYRVLRERPADLHRALTLTPYSREEYNLAQLISPDPLEDARRFCIIAGQGNRGAGTIDAGGWRWMKNFSRTSTPAHDWTNNTHLYDIARRFAAVQIEHEDALTILQRYDTSQTLFYVDPPYLASTRCMRWSGDAYENELADPAQHETLARALHEISGMVALSGYPSELYNDLYHDWKRIDRAVTIRVRSGNWRGKQAIESLWLNYTPPQLSLFGNVTS